MTAQPGTSGLKAVAGRPSLGDYLRQMWQRRHFIRVRARAMVLSRHQDSLLGNLWLILAPTLDGLVYFLIFGVLLDVHRGGIDNFFAYLCIGVFFFTFTARTLSSSVGVIRSNRGLIRAFSFPRATLPMAVLMRELYGMVPVFLTLGALLIIVPPHALPTWHWLLVPFVFALQVLITFGLSALVARIGHLLPDMATIMRFVIRLWMYISCVLWTIDRFEELGREHHVPWVGAMARNNPLFLVLDSVRQLMVFHQLPPADHWYRLLAWSVGLVVVGVLIFWQGEESYGRAD